jgi:phosphomannomutase
MGMGTMKMNRFTYTQLSYTYGKYLVNKFGKNKTVIIGHDNRLNSDTFAILCANVLTSFGLKPLLFKNNKLMPTPIISYAIRQTKSIGGIIVTASHNPKEYNGFKVYNPDGGQVLPDVVEQITKYMCKPIDILDIVYKPNKKLIGYVNDSLINKYMNDVQAALVDKSVTRKTKSFPIVFTGHHGTSCKLIPIFLKKLKFNVKPVIKQCFYNPNFINSPVSNPEDFKSFDLAIKQANKIKSKIIIGIDPDADRMAVCLKHHDK